MSCCGLTASVHLFWVEKEKDQRTPPGSHIKSIHRTRNHESRALLFKQIYRFHSLRPLSYARSPSSSFLTALAHFALETIVSTNKKLHIQKRESKRAFAVLLFSKPFFIQNRGDESRRKNAGFSSCWHGHPWKPSWGQP